MRVSGSKIPVLHAWNVDAEGSVIDSTWEPVGSIYFGVIFPVSIVRGAKTSVLDDWENGWPVLRESWTAAVGGIDGLVSTKFWARTTKCSKHLSRCTRTQLEAQYAAYQRMKAKPSLFGPVPTSGKAESRLLSFLTGDHHIRAKQKND